MNVKGEAAMGSAELKATTLGITIQILNWVNVKYKSDIFYTTNVYLWELNTKKIYDTIGVATYAKKQNVYLCVSNFHKNFANFENGN